MFEWCDALLCTDGAVRTVVYQAPAPEHRRGHGLPTTVSAWARSTWLVLHRHWSVCRCRGVPTAGSCRLCTSLRGCGRMSPRALTGLWLH
jgi:hypothetical protein